jgi:hypothetical protein
LTPRRARPTRRAGAGQGVGIADHERDERHDHRGDGSTPVAIAIELAPAGEAGLPRYWSAKDAGARKASNTADHVGRQAELGHSDQQHAAEAAGDARQTEPTQPVGRTMIATT